MARTKWGTALMTVLLAAGVSLLQACGKPTARETPLDRVAHGGAPSAGSASMDSDAKRADLLNRIRKADPDKKTIERALMNGDRELALVLSRQTNLDDVPKLMRSMLAEMEKTFPGEDHTAIAYTPTEPPHEIGVGHSDARTRQMTYTPSNPR